MRKNVLTFIQNDSKTSYHPFNMQEELSLQSLDTAANQGLVDGKKFKHFFFEYVIVLTFSTNTQQEYLAT